MDIPSMDSINKHPDYESTIEELINNHFDKTLMAQAAKVAKMVDRESQAEAIYVFLKLKRSLPQTLDE